MKKRFLSMALVLVMALSLVFAVTVTVSADNGWASFCYDIGEGGWIEVFGVGTDPEGKEYDWTSDGKDVCKNPDEQRVQDFRMITNQTVKVVIYPDAGKGVDKVTLNGEAIEVTDNTFEFIFNETNTVAVTFKDEVIEKGWASFFYNIGEGGWIEVYGIGTDPEGNSHDWTEDGKNVCELPDESREESFRMFTNQTVKVVIYPDAGKVVDEVTLNGEAIEVTDNTFEFSFDEANTVAVTFKDEVIEKGWASFFYNIGEGGWIEVYGIGTDPEGNSHDWTEDGKNVCELPDESREESFRMFTNQTVKVVIYPDSGKVIDKVTLNDAEVPVTKNTVEFEFNDNNTLAVTFKDAEVNPSITAGEPVSSANYIGETDKGETVKSDYSIIMYGTITEGSNDALKEYGYTITKLGADGNAVGDMVSLPALAGLTSDGVFAIRCVGTGIVKGDYRVQPYLITESGAEYTANAITVPVE